MEENEYQCNNNNNSMKNSISLSSHAAVLSSDPLFSTFATLYILILLYFPRLFFKIVFSPVLLITLILLLILLRFGATQRNENRENIESNCTDEVSEISCSYLDQDHKWVAWIDTSFGSNSCFEESFVEWNVRAPLEVIYEAYEGEEEEEEENIKDPNNKKSPGDKDPTRTSIERYPSLSSYYPETDSDTSSEGDFLAIGDWGSPESVCYRWEDEDREGLIEIALDPDHDHGHNNKRESLDFENFNGEEENNLIEIDISPVKNEEKWRFSGESLS
ncbi:putative Transmembrane protein [Melia azedarach]|uniref:Transmembrane protein n=1 Tax=Melia azedarach TaxID=155640 RepID=A0ACC1WWC4_MELAZ|nr:putative Transmembrane protein [Melia azedarach]